LTNFFLKLAPDLQKESGTLSENKMIVYIDDIFDIKIVPIQLNDAGQGAD